jgi:hypothetical protein
MHNEHDVWNTAPYHPAIRKRIGEALSARHDVSRPLPARLRILLRQLDEPRTDDIAVNEPRHAAEA